MDLPERVLQGGCESDLVGCKDAISLATCSARMREIIARGPARGLSWLGRVQQRGDACALDVVGHADDRGLDDGRVGDERRLDLHGAHAMARDVDDVVDTAHDPEVAVGIAAGAVACEIEGRARGSGGGWRGPLSPGGGHAALQGLGVLELELREVGLDEPWAVAVDGAEHGGPWAADAQEPSRVCGAFAAELVHDGGVDAEEGERA